MLLPMDSPSLLLLLLCTHDVRFILLGGGGRGRFGGDDLEGDDLGGDDLHDEACEEEVELVADIVDGDNDGGVGDDDSPIVLLRRGGVECIILFGIVMHRCIL